MKSFVYTVVAATIAASSAVANTTDASTSGTVPTVQPYCQFSNISDGIMHFVPGFKSDNGSEGVGFWRTDRTGPAQISVQAAGAYKVSVIGGTKVKNRNDGTEYPVKVDYSAMHVDTGTYSVVPEMAEYGFQGQNGYNTAITSVTGVGGHWDKSGLVKLFHREQSNPTWAPDRPWWGQIPSSTNSAPTDTPYYTNVSPYQYVHDQVDVEFSSSLLEVDFHMHINGNAWMLDSDGEMKYESDGLGRRTPPVGGYPNGKAALSYYGMTDGDYYIEHTVQCLQ